MLSFTPRRVCLTSFAYGACTGLMVACGILAVVQPSGLLLAIAGGAALIGKLCHGSLPPTSAAPADHALDVL